MDYVLSGVSHRSVDDEWDEIKQYVQVALDRTEGELSLEDIKQHLEDREMQLWILIDPTTALSVGALVTQIMEYSRKKACRYVTLGGDIHGHFDTITQLIEAWAQSEGCDRMEIVGRRGWTKALNHLGYSEAYSYVTKELNDE